jgi:hypothetical protein
MLLINVVSTQLLVQNGTEEYRFIHNEKPGGIGPTEVSNHSNTLMFIDGLQTSSGFGQL